MLVLHRGKKPRPFSGRVRLILSWLGIDDPDRVPDHDPRLVTVFSRGLQIGDRVEQADRRFCYAVDDVGREYVDCRRLYEAVGRLLLPHNQQQIIERAERFGVIHPYDLAEIVPPELIHIAKRAVVKVNPSEVTPDKYPNSEVDKYLAATKPYVELPGADECFIELVEMPNTHFELFLLIAPEYFKRGEEDV